MKKTIINIFTIILLGYNLSQANAIGSEFQSFNPDISGTHFITVHSSEPVKQCMCNLGVAFNYAKNTYSYSDFYYATGLDLRGVRANDYLFGADVYAAFGITNNWDIGVDLPFVVSANNSDPYDVNYFEKFGLTEVRPMTKYRFYGDSTGGAAVVLSANFNTIQGNPFTGLNPGPTFNLEFAADTSFAGDFKAAANIGYRKRSPGSQVVYSVSGLLVPFVPFSDAYIFSAALAKNFEKIKTTFVAEFNGSQAAKSIDENVKRSQQVLEFNLGLRHAWAKNIVLQGGLGTKVADSQASPDIRVYTGLNFQVGPVCGVKEASHQEANVNIPSAVVKNSPEQTSSATALNMEITALNPTDFTAYRWKIGATATTNCTDEKSYSSEIAGDMPIVTDIGTIPDGGITLCSVAKNLNGEWQPFTDPTVTNWIKKGSEGAGPVAVIKNAPKGTSDIIDLNLGVSAQDASSFAAYKWKIGPSPEMNCNESSGYSAEISAEKPIITGIGELPDGGITLCALAKNKNGIWQSFNNPSYETWEKKKGFELFRLNANVLFDFNSAELQKMAYAELEKISRHLNKKPFAKCIIEGHTDFKGSDKYNLDLSARRALTVKNYLVKTFGFNSDKFLTKGLGEAYPVDSAQTDEACAKNRRVEFKIYRP